LRVDFSSHINFSYASSEKCGKSSHPLPAGVERGAPHRLALQCRVSPIRSRPTTRRSPQPRSDGRQLWELTPAPHPLSAFPSWPAVTQSGTPPQQGCGRASERGGAPFPPSPPFTAFSTWELLPLIFSSQNCSAIENAPSLSIAHSPNAGLFVVVFLCARTT
jgi:hypothetical protein